LMWMLFLSRFINFCYDHFCVFQWRRLHLLIFFTEVIKFYWLMLLLYPGELYRLLGASSSSFFLSSVKSLSDTFFGDA
jgi:hypothetical protein